jgi:hypothetical protein
MKKVIVTTGKNRHKLPFTQQFPLMEHCTVIDHVVNNLLMPAGRTERKKIWKYPFIALRSMLLVFFTLTAKESYLLFKSVEL